MYVCYVVRVGKSDCDIDYFLKFVYYYVHIYAEMFVYSNDHLPMLCYI